MDPEGAFNVYAVGGPSSAAVRKAIEAHLNANPSAADTARGIATCWLPRRGLEVDLASVVEVLESMVANQQLCAFYLPDGELLYERGPRFADP